ncbi:uncharacterized protein LOC121384163 isoform X2 [Gigantopelta aegis]|uniref:uncharacterized protein LOC121384163 isoform X2 n=1 Tax=Gigantopelta aegis TaxID=1735272 RepID=UPI001B88DAC9|nr:uncharacterized protein LOC121384163 isoform X2 [Gigantopelta aegis]
MAGWTSLSGYLSFKQGGALGRLKSRKKMWCVLEESQHQLLYYKDESRTRRKEPEGSINLKGAAITLDLDNENQFIIINDEKSYVLMAENHESMMIWLLALQAKRDHQTEKNPHNNNQSNEFETRRRSVSDVSAANIDKRSHKLLCMTKSLTMNQTMQDSTRPDWRRYQLSRLGEPVDTHIKKAFERVDRSRSLPPVFEFEEIPESFVYPYNRQMSISMDSCGPNAINKVGNPGGESSSGSAADSDDIFGDKSKRRKSKDSSWGQKLRLKMHMENDSDSYNESGVSEDRRHSSLSASSDSAIDTQDAVGRVMELEKDLIATKCELAKIMNRQTCIQEIMKQKDEIIGDLDEKLGQLGHGDQAYDSKKRTSRISKDLQERIRVLQNQNRFLNEEVRRLAKLRTNEQSAFEEQDGKVQWLEAEIDKWKLDYVSLIQSSIRFTGSDTMDDAELILFGGDKHKNRVLGLLEEARKINPSLPTYERLMHHDVHVDCYGFKHQFEDSGLLLHYLCQELTLHYQTQAGTYERHQHSWMVFLQKHSKQMLKNKKELKSLCHGGIPDQYRKQVWRHLVYDRMQDMIMEKGQHYYRNLCSLVPDSPLAARYRKQVSLDLMRTMPSNVKFSTPGSRGVMDLQDILLSFCIHNPQIGYCQGMNFIVGMALLFMDAQDAFWTLVAVTERYFTPNYFDHNLVGAQADQHVLKDLIHTKLPRLWTHLEEIDIEVSTITLNWFLGIFFDAVPFQTLLRVWDCFLLEGPKVLFRICLAILKMHEKEILLKADTISVMRHLKTCAKLTFDIDGLIKTAFEDLKPFPSRQTILTKQTCYLKTLKEKYKKKELQKLAFAEREQLFLALEADSGHCLTFECCAAQDNGEVWLCYGEQKLSKVCQVKSSQGVMVNLPLEFDTRVMCSLPLPGGLVLFGTLSWTVSAYNTYNRQKLWQTLLHDAVLSLCNFSDEDTPCRIFAGLADGTIAIIENAAKEMPNFDTMYIPIGQSPVTCVKLLGNHLWCACGNKVYIIHASTLDNLDNFTVSTNPYDHILSLEVGIPGVWISIRGSSILELWDPLSLSCKMLYDTRSGRYPSLRKEDETYFNKARITSILPHESTVWIGTGEGNLIIYDVVETTTPCVTPSEASFNTDLAENLKWRKKNSIDGGFDPIRAVEEKVREMYYQGLASDDVNLTTTKPYFSRDGQESEVQMYKISTTSTSSTVIVTDESSGFSNQVLSSTPANSNSFLGHQNFTSSVTSSPASFWYDSCGKSFSHNDPDMNASSLVDSCEGNPSESDVKVEDSTKEVLSPGIASKFLTDGNKGKKRKSLRRKLFETDEATENDMMIVGNFCKDQADNDSESDEDSKLGDASPADTVCEVRNGEISSDTSRDSQLRVANNCMSSSEPSKKVLPVENVSVDPAENKTTTKRPDCLPVVRSGRLDSGIKLSSNMSTSSSASGSKGKRLTNNQMDSTESDVFISGEGKNEANDITETTIQNGVCDDEDKEVQPVPKDETYKVEPDSEQTEKDISSHKDESGQVYTNGHSSSEKSLNCNHVFKNTKKKHSSRRSRGNKNNGTQFYFSDSEEEVFEDAIDNFRKIDSNENLCHSGINIPHSTSDSTSSLKSCSKSLPKSFELGRLDSCSSCYTNLENVRPKSPDAQWRLEFTGIHVDTDCESRMSNMDLSEADSFSFSSNSHRISIDSNTSDLLVTTNNKGSSSTNNLSTFSPQNFIFPEDYSLEQKIEKFLQTPSFSATNSSRAWSSYDEISTPPKGKQKAGKGRDAVLQSDASRGTSSVSLMTMGENMFCTDLNLQAKVKISDKPVKCLVNLVCNNEPLILSLAGCYGDDEAVLKWKKEPNEMLWTNDPILEYCMDTKTTILPTYMRGRMSSSSSIHSNRSASSVKSREHRLSGNSQ